MKKTLKRRSKKLTTRQRIKQEKKKREYDRKIRKDKREHPEKYRKSKKDPGVPNSCPFKEDVLREVEAARAAKIAEKEKRRELLKLKRKAEKEAKGRGGLEALMKDAQKKDEAFEKGQAFKDEAKAFHGVSDRSAKAYYKEFSKVIEAADVVLEVLDARDPLGTRCVEVEQAVLKDGLRRKRIVLVLNKADLVPKENLEKWITYLRRELPTIAFKASTQPQSSRLGQSKLSIAKASDSDLQTSKCIGADTLLTLLGNYCRNKDVKMSIRVGVVGLPNVGKSSIINSLKRSKACGVGSTPGVTKAMQEVTLDSKVKLLDSPGMVLASGSMTDAGVALRNAIKVESLEDPVTPVEAILQRCNKQQMMLRYKISNYEDVMEFLNLVARGMGKLKKGGIPNAEMAARVILQDWNSGKIKYFTHPPELDQRSSHISAEIVEEFSKEFNIDEMLDKMETEDLQKLPNVLPSQTMLVTSEGIVKETQKVDDDDSEEEEMEEDNDDDDDENLGQLSNKISIQASVKASKTKAAIKDDKKDEPLFKLEGNMRLKKLEKLREKKEKKERKRRDKVAVELAHGMEAAFQSLSSDNDKYDFDKDFDIK